MTMATTPHLPATVDAAGLARIPEPYREAYIDYDDAGQRYEKNDRIVAYVTSQLTEIERLSADIAATKATSDAEIARLRKERDDDDINGSLHAALARRGVNPKLVNAAAALLRNTVLFEVEDNDYGEGRTVVGRTRENFLVSADGAVESFLLSDEGAPFAPASDKTGDSYFTSMIAEMKRRR